MPSAVAVFIGEMNMPIDCRAPIVTMSSAAPASVIRQ
jgi:hypothetical protein